MIIIDNMLIIIVNILFVIRSLRNARSGFQNLLNSLGAHVDFIKALLRLTNHTETLTGVAIAQLVKNFYLR